MASRRAQLEVRTVLVGWCAVMRQIRAGYIVEPRESVHRVTSWTLEALDKIERAHVGDPQMADLVRDARSEVHGATHHDLADSGQQAG